MSPADIQARLSESFESTLQEASRAALGGPDVRRTLQALAARLASAGIGYLIFSGMALGDEGRVRMTEDVDVLVAPAGLARFVATCVGKGYAPAYPGATHAFRDLATGVRIKFSVSGDVSAAAPAAESAIEVGGVQLADPPPRAPRGRWAFWRRSAEKQTKNILTAPPRRFYPGGARVSRAAP